MIILFLLRIEHENIQSQIKITHYKLYHVTCLLQSRRSLIFLLLQCADKVFKATIMFFLSF